MSVNSNSRRSSRKSRSSGSSLSASEEIDIKQMLKIEKKFPYFVDKSMEELEQMKSFLCEKQEYDKFINLQTYIDFRKKENTSYVLAVFKKWLQEGINEAAQNFDINISQIKEQIQLQKQAIAKDHELLLSQINKNKINEIEKLNIEKSSEIDREKKRQSPEVRNLLNLSQKYAVANQTELAKKAKKDALLKQKAQFENKQQQIELKYIQFIKKIQQKHKNDTEAAKMKYNSQLTTIKRELLSQTEEQKKKLSVFVLFLQQRAITEGSKELIKKEKKTTLKNEITDYVYNHIFDIGKGFLFEGIES
ncbi:hypothetical protein M9Y10_001845 [Tritrichomonas musculus]|uniref:Uncharacterized protein n=1 Tax=Tritrichomonas musculus TaxID=1915356 RepID=A0ABR2L840_9EUKA